MIKFLKLFLNRKVQLTISFLLLAIVIYFLTIESQGEVVSISIGRFGEKYIAVVPAQHDGAVAWMEARFVTDVPTHTPLPELTQKPTDTTEPTRTPRGTQAFTPTSTATPYPTLTPTSHAYFVGYKEPIKTYNTYGESVSAASLEINGRLYLVIADGAHGLRIVDVTKPDLPQETRYPLREAYSVKVIGTGAYIAAGNDGVVILDLANPMQPIAIDRRATIGPALDLDVLFRFFYTEDKATGGQRGYYKTRIYVAMGHAGMQVITISPIPEDTTKPENNNKFIKNKYSVKPVYYDTDDQVLAITEAHYSGMTEFVFIADGKDGVKVLDLSTAYNRPVRDSDVVHSFDITAAWDVAFVRLLEHRARQDRQFFWLIVAAGEDGVFAYKVNIDPSPREATYDDGLAINTPGEARAITIYHNNIFVGDGEGGVQVIDFNDPDHPVLMGSGHYEFNWRSIPIIYALKQWVFKNIQSPGSAMTIANTAIDGLLCIISLLVVAFLLTGIMLPARTVRERLKVMRLTLANWLNIHGTAWIIEDGQPRHRTSEKWRHGVGITLQDPNSAAVFDQHLGKPRVSGAQLTFTGKEEHLVWQTELRRQQLIVGPKYDDPDPFRTRGSNEERGEYRARQYRRRLMAGKTKDDVEIVATLRVVYSLEGQTVDDQNEFGFESGAVSRAYQGERPPAFDRSEDPLRYRARRQPVGKLLEKLVSELWKLNLSRYSLTDLFPPLNQQKGQTPALQNILQMMTDLLVSNQTGVLFEYENEANIASIREDYRQLVGGQRPGGGSMRTPDPGRGVRVHEVQLEGLRISEEDTQRLLQQWIDDWRIGNQPEQIEIQERANQETLIQFAEYAVQYLRDMPEGQVQVKRLVESLVRLLQGTLKALPPGVDRERLLAAIRQLGGSER